MKKTQTHPLRATKRNSSSIAFGIIAAIAVNLAIGTAARATVVTWDTSTTAGIQDAAGTWSTGASDWTVNGTVLSGWINGNDAVIGASGGTPGTITVSSAITVNSITFGPVTTGFYTISGSAITLTSGSISVGASASTTNGQGTIISNTISGANGLTITGTGGGLVALTGSNNYTGTTTVTGGSTLRLSNVNALSSTTNVALNNGSLESTIGLNSMVFANGLGTGVGQISLTGTVDFGARLVAGLVEIGSTNSVLVWGSTNFTPTTLGFNSFGNLGGSSAALTFANGLDLNGASRQITIGLSAITMTGGLAGTNVALNVVGIGAAGASFTLTGTSTLTGTMAISGANSTILNAADGVGLSGSANLLIGNNGFYAGNLTRAVGTGAGQIQFGATNAGFSGNGSNVTIALSGTLVVGTGATALPKTLNFNVVGGLAGSVNFNTAVDLSGNNLTINHNDNGNNAPLTISGNIMNSSGTGGVTFNNPNGAFSAIYITGSDSYNGVTTLSGGGGRVILGGTTGVGTLSGTGGIAMGAGGAQFGISTSGTTTINSVISGSAALAASFSDGSSGDSIVINGTNTGLTGTVIFNAANTYTGNTLIKAGTLQIGSGSNTGVLPAATVVTGSTGSTLAFDRSDNITISNTISGAVGVTQAGSGMLTLNGGGNQSYTGATTVSSGTLQLGDGTTDGGISSSGTLANNSTVIFNNVNSETFLGKITGSGAIIKNNSGNQKISGTNTYTGATTVNAGTLQLGSANALGSTSSLTVASTGTLNLSNGVTTQSVTLTGSTGTTLTLAGGSTLAFGVGNGTADSLNLTSGATPSISGTTTILISALSGANVTNFTIISSPSGGLEPGGSGAPSFVLGALPALTQGFITQSGTAIQLTFSAVTTVYWLGGGSGGNSNWNTTSAPGNNFTSDAAGTSILNAMFGTAQDVIFSATSAAHESNTNLNGNVTAHSLLINDTGAVGINSGTSTLTLTGASGNTGITTGSGAGLLTIGTNIAFAPSAIPNITVNSANGVVISGTIGGAQGLLINGTGLLTLTGANNYTGGTTFTSGTLNVNSDAAFGAASGTFTFSPGSGSNAVLQTATSFVSGSSRNFVFSTGTGSIDTQGNTFTINGLISGTGVFNKIGAGTLVLTGSDSGFSGIATASSGTLQIQNPNWIGTVSSGTFNSAPGGTLNLLLSGVISYIPAHAVTFGGNGTLLLSGSGGQLEVGGGSALNYTIAMTGGTIEVGSGFRWENGGPTAGGAIWTTNKASLQIDASGTFDPWDNTTAVTPVNIDVLTGSGQLNRGGFGTGGAWVTMGVNNGSGTFNGNITNSLGTISITKTGTGTQTFSGSNGYSGFTAVTGGTLRVTNSNGLGFGDQTFVNVTGVSNHTTTVSGSATLDLSASGTINNAVTLNNGSLINSSTSAASTLDSGIAGLTFTSDPLVNSPITLGTSGGSGAGFSGTAATNGTNMYVQVLSAGTGYTPGAGAPTVTLTQSGGGVGGTVTAVVSSLSLTGSNNSIGGAGNLIVNAQISGTGGFTKVGGGTLTLSGSNIYSGTTTVSQGNLSVTNTAGSATGTAGVNLTAATASITTLSGNGIIGGSVITSATSGVVGVAHLAPGVNVSGANNNFGTAGILTLSNGLTIGDGTNLDYDLGPTSDLINVTGNLSLGSNIVLNYQSLGGSLVGNTAYDLINFTGTLSGSGALASWTANGTAPAGTTSTTFAVSGTMITVTFNMAATTPAVAYWQGVLGASGTGAWNTVTSGSTNFTTDAAGTINTQVIPGAVTNVKFTANSGSNVNTTLGQDFTINSLEFTGSASSPVTIGGTNTLTINATGTNGNTPGNGITVDAGSAAHLISSNVALGSSQVWTINGNTLTVSGNISDGGNGFGLTKSGTGVLDISGSASYSGTT
ncbi:MAG: autotransporter-associated beta strand repeat-containing protein, partial [Chthoniobacteraceae bacterium]